MAGGPVRVIEARNLRPTAETREQDFQFFPGLPTAGGAETKKKTVNVFSVDLMRVTA